MSMLDQKDLNSVQFANIIFYIKRTVQIYEDQRNVILKSSLYSQKRDFKNGFGSFVRKQFASYTFFKKKNPCKFQWKYKIQIPSTWNTYETKYALQTYKKNAIKKTLDI